MTAKILNFARQSPGTPPLVETGSEPGAPTHGNCAAPLPILTGARLVEFVGRRPAIRIELPDRSAFLNAGWGWQFIARSGDKSAVTVPATCEALSAWVLEQRREASKAKHPCNVHHVYNMKGNQ